MIFIITLLFLIVFGLFYWELRQVSRIEKRLEIFSEEIAMKEGIEEFNRVNESEDESYLKELVK